MNLFNANRLDYPYHPHMTVAFRDLKKELFTLAWDEFESKQYAPSFEVNTITLLKHDGKEWKQLKQFDFGN